MDFVTARALGLLYQAFPGAELISIEPATDTEPVTVKFVSVGKHRKKLKQETTLL